MNNKPTTRQALYKELFGESQRELTAKEKIIAIARKAGYGIDDRKDKLVIYL